MEASADRRTDDLKAPLEHARTPQFPAAAESRSLPSSTAVSTTVVGPQDIGGNVLEQLRQELAQLRLGVAEGVSIRLRKDLASLARPIENGSMLHVSEQAKPTLKEISPGGPCIVAGKDPRELSDPHEIATELTEQLHAFLRRSSWLLAHLDPDTVLLDREADDGKAGRADLPSTLGTDAL